MPLLMELTLLFHLIATFNFFFSWGSFDPFKLAPLSQRQNKLLLVLSNPLALPPVVNCQTYWENCLLLVISVASSPSLLNTGLHSPPPPFRILISVASDLFSPYLNSWQDLHSFLSTLQFLWLPKHTVSHPPSPTHTSVLIFTLQFSCHGTQHCVVAVGLLMLFLLN